jgi:ketosteroid isomerase-like protein
MSDHTRETVEKFYALLGAGDTAAVIGLLADDFHWEIPGDVDTAPWLGLRTTTQEVEEFFVHQGNHLEREAFDIDHIVVDGPDAVVLGRAAGRVRSTGKPLEFQFAVHFVVDVEGRISRYVFFEDSWHIAEAMRP